MNLKQKAIEQSLKALQNLGCSYIVADPDGNKHEHGRIRNKKVKKERNYPYGALRAHYGPYILDLKPGENAIVPSNGFDLIDIQSGICAKSVALWGKGSFVTTINREKDHVEVLRMI
jgi:hypothetical protein